jgi:hypothetical protein
MGNDLYWKQTPKEPEEHQYNGLSYSTWHFLAELWNEEDKNDLSGKTLTMKDIPQIEVILATAKFSNNQDLVEDMLDLIAGIMKWKSITLFVEG